MRKISELSFDDLLPEIYDAVMNKLTALRMAPFNPPDFKLQYGFVKVGLHEHGTFRLDKTQKFVTYIHLVNGITAEVLTYQVTFLLNNIEE